MVICGCGVYLNDCCICVGCCDCLVDVLVGMGFLFCEKDGFDVYVCFFIEMM